MKNITVKYGSEMHTVTIGSGATIGQIIMDCTCKVVLGYGDNVKALVSGVEQSLDSIPSDGTTISLETKANQKAK